LGAGLLGQAAFGGTASYTGTLNSPEDSATFTVDLANPGTLELQTWGFGGGTNAAGTVISAGGFDPFVGVFSGTGDSAVLVDGTSDVLSNYGSYTGCPPAGMVDIGGDTCGDVNMSFSLAAGTYTVLLTDAEYIPVATFETDGMLGDGFYDFTAGVFQTCNGNTCITPTANFALDITTPDSVAATPEPRTMWFAGIGVVLLASARRRQRRKKLEEAVAMSRYVRRMQ
jgi:hypothetical protein